MIRRTAFGSILRPSGLPARTHLQLIVAGKLQQEGIGRRVAWLQFPVNRHAAHAAGNDGFQERRIGQIAVITEYRKHAAEPFDPVARTKGFPALGNAPDHDFRRAFEHAADTCILNWFCSCILKPQSPADRTGFPSRNRGKLSLQIKSWLNENSCPGGNRPPCFFVEVDGPCHTS